jgi:hypothetical protein
MTSGIASGGQFAVALSTNAAANFACWLERGTVQDDLG